MLEAALIASRDSIAKITLIGEESKIKETAKANKLELPKIEYLSSRRYEKLPELASIYATKRKITIEEATTEICEHDLLFAALLAKTGRVDGVLGGSFSTTAQVVRAALRGIGTADGVSVLSSLFLMYFPAMGDYRPKELLIGFGDCSVIPDPTDVQLADIARSSAATFHSLTGEIPRVALLSFSTKGSALTESTEKVLRALAIIKKSSPELIIDGELQFDAAFVPDVAARKAPDSPVAGRANIFIFPDLDAGNIGYKIAERLGMGQAIGPVMQGLAVPMNDLSRGAHVSDIVNMIAITALQTVQTSQP